MSTPLRRPLSIVTGANNGFGFGLTELLLARGHDVVMACRNEVLAAAAASKLSASVAPHGAPSRGSPIVMALDLASLKSVCDFAAAFNAAHGERQLTFLVNNAGIAVLGARTVNDSCGCESTVAVNHVGHAGLFNLLLPILERCKTRVVAVSSLVHKNGVQEAGKPLDEGSAISAYANSKLLNTMWAFEVQRRFCDRGITCNSGHPGSGLYTGLGGASTLATVLRATLIPLLTPLLWIFGFSQSWHEGGVAELAACDTPTGGLYLYRAQVSEASAGARDAAACAWVWTETQHILRDAAAKHGLNPALSLSAQ